MRSIGTVVTDLSDDAGHYAAFSGMVAEVVNTLENLRDGFDNGGRHEAVIRVMVPHCHGPWHLSVSFDGDELAMHHPSVPEEGMVAA